ncbi:MAG: histidinol dehydrogenase [Desulfobacterales bacterium]
MKIFKYPSKEAEARLLAIINRGFSFSRKDHISVSRILEDVRKNGDRALIGYIRKFDSPSMVSDSLKVTRKEVDYASKVVEKAFITSLKRAIGQIESFHKQQIRLSWISNERNGTFLGQIVNPVDAAGVYVPGGKGGKTPLVSSVLMGAIPAKIAGVRRVVMITPPTKDGGVSPYLLVAAKMVGIDEIYKAGSAWAIAALAYGTETIQKTDVIVGPGNIYVTIAKKIVSGIVGIDMTAGPSEILVIADKSAVPEYAASDLLSQAEHDVLASSILLTDSTETAVNVKRVVEVLIQNLERKDIAEKSISKFGAIMVVPDISVAIDLSNRIAPEHLELQIENPFEYIGKIRNAGAVFLGNYTPEPVGDYIAGPNHVLPTAGTARFSSALSVDNFIKKTSLISYSKDAFFREAKDIIRLAETEGLGAHADSVRVRLKKNPTNQKIKTK